MNKSWLPIILIQIQFYNPHLLIEKTNEELGHTMQKLADRRHHVDIQILDNEVSTEFKKTIENDWDAKYQWVPPNVHRRNISERAFITFKSHFLAILTGVDLDFPKYMWDNLLVQTVLTINLLRQATLNPRMSEWEYYNGALDYSATPFATWRD